MTTLHGDWTGLLSFVSAALLSTFILLFLPSSSVSLSNFYLAVPMRGCLGKHSCMSSSFPIGILNGTCSLRALILFCGDVPAIKTKLNKQTKFFVLQTKAIRAINNLAYNEHTNAYFKCNKILKLSDQYKLQVSNYIFSSTTLQY